MNAQLARFSGAVLSFLLLVPFGFSGENTVKKATARAADGLTIAYDVRGQGGTSLVFLHGWCGDRASWKHQLDAFADDYRVVAIDLGGHGASGKDRKEWSVIGLAGDVEAVVKDLGLKRVILVGHSMGGPIGLATAKRMPGTVIAVIGADTLNNAEYQWPEDQSKKFLAAFEADFKATMRMGIKGMLPENVDPKLFEWIAGKAEAQDPRMALGLFRDFPRLDTKTLLKEAKVPVRCINASLKFQFGIPTAIDVNKKYADFDAVIMEDVGHFPMLERPAEFNQKMRHVLKEFAAK